MPEADNLSPLQGLTIWTIPRFLGLTPQAKYLPRLRRSIELDYLSLPRRRRWTGAGALSRRSVIDGIEAGLVLVR